MTEPIRWIDDPAFKMRTGIRIEDDDALMGSYDLDAMAARLGDTIGAADASSGASGQGASAGPGGTSSASGAASALGTKGVLTLVTATAVLSVGLGALLPALMDTKSTAEVATLASADLRDEAAAPSFATTLKVAPVKSGPVDEGESLDESAPRDGSARAASSATRVAKAPPAQATRSVASALAEEIAAYERGARALEKGDAAAAVKALRRYRERFPAGRLHGEAMISELDALIRLGLDDEAIEHSLAILGEASMRPRWDDVIKSLHVLARRADRCDEVHARLKIRKVSRRALARFLTGCE